MPYSALNRAATRAWWTPSTVKVAMGRVGVSSPGPRTVTPGMAPSPERSRRASCSSWCSMGGQPMRSSFVDGGVESDRAEDVGGAGFFAFGRVGPHDLVEVDEVDGAATGEERVAVGEGASRPDEGAGAEGRVHLVPAPRHEVDRGWETSVGCELGGVDEDGDAALVGGHGDVVDGGHPAGDVGRTGDGQQLRMWCDVEGRRDVVDGEGAVGRALDEPAAGHARPRQQVGVMLDDGRDDDIVRARGGAGRRDG